MLDAEVFMFPSGWLDPLEHPWLFSGSDTALVPLEMMSYALRKQQRTAASYKEAEWKETKRLS